MHCRRALAGLAVLLLVARAAGAQPAAEVVGTVRSPDGRPVAGALVEAAEQGVHTATGPDGAYRLPLEAGEHVVRVTAGGYRAAEHRMRVSPGSAAVLDVVLEAAPRFADEVTVSAVRASALVPVTTTELSAGEVERRYHGQEMPVLLQAVPSVTFYSDTGTGHGYAYMYLRGIPQTRMNVTLDGAPLNEAEDSTLYFVDFGDFASNVQSAQVQRGVGTSVPGAASFAGSVNFASVDISDERTFSARVGAGAFGTGRASVAAHSGVVGPGLKFYGRASWQQSDGFREHADVEQRSVFFGAARQGDRSFWKVFGFAGHERTGLSFLAVERPVLDQNPRENPLDPAERDAFGQRFVQAQYHRAAGESVEWSVQGYFNGAGGAYRLWDDAVARTALLEYGLDWRMVGTTTTVRGRWRNASLAWGLHANDFRSHHTQDVVGGSRAYGNRGTKNEVSSFGRIGLDAGRWHHYADAQVRWARFRYRGALDLGDVSWMLFNPKVGTRVAVAPGVSVYASVGRAMREPTRSDMLSGEDNPSLQYDLTAVRPERVVDVEAGIEAARGAWSAQVNAYAMEFRDEIALTGELSAIGLPLRRNVDRSSRRGLEVDAAWTPASSLRVHHTANVSWNGIARWTQFYDVYDEAGEYVGSEPRVHEDVRPLLTPAYVGNLAVDWQAAPWLTTRASGRYVSKAYLDNTQNDAFTTPGWFTLDGSVAVRLGRLLRAGSPVLRVHGINLLNRRTLFPSGYSYLYLVRDASGRDTLQGTSYYYPLATRSAFVTLEIAM